MSAAAETAARRYDVDDSTGCWLWNGRVSPNGYAQITVFGQATEAHRISYQLHKGFMSPFHEIHHTCRNRSCINPDHLRAVTHPENVQEGHLAKLTVEQVREIRAAPPGTPQRELAERFDVSTSTIGMVLRRKTWINVA